MPPPVNPVRAPIVLAVIKKALLLTPAHACAPHTHTHARTRAQDRARLPGATPCSSDCCVTSDGWPSLSVPPLPRLKMRLATASASRQEARRAPAARGTRRSSAMAVREGRHVLGRGWRFSLLGLGLSCTSVSVLKTPPGPSPGGSGWWPAGGAVGAGRAGVRTGQASSEQALREGFCPRAWGAGGAVCRGAARRHASSPEVLECFVVSLIFILKIKI